MYNVKGKRYTKKALLSYSISPFRDYNQFLRHPNYIENYTLADILDSHGYIVDVYNNTFDGSINYKQYDLIIGEGLPISKYFLIKHKLSKTIPTIYYATGSHPLFSNIESYRRLFDFYYRKGKLLIGSSRILDSRWALGASLADSIVLLGNDVTKETFTRYAITKKIYKLNPPYYSTNVITDFSKKDPKQILWFGSFGLIHKGLDTVLETFAVQPDFQLHVCGYLGQENEFLESYKDELAHATNIKLHGFVNIASAEFKKLMEECSFVLLASCSEGCATAIITAMGNGGLIPIINKECGLNPSSAVYIDTISKESITKSLKKLSILDHDAIADISRRNIKYIAEQFSIERYKETLSDVLNNIINDI
jgi:glycosyltransferase involved in cell wall biosynthesis